MCKGGNGRPQSLEDKRLGLPMGLVSVPGCVQGQELGAPHHGPNSPGLPHPQWMVAMLATWPPAWQHPNMGGASQIHQGNPVQLEGWSPLRLGHPRPGSPSGFLMVRGGGRRVPKSPQHSDSSRRQVCQWLLTLLLPQGTLLP